MNKLLQGNCFEVLKTLDENSIDAIITDPPYGIKFMGKKWDHSVPNVDVFKQMLRVLKPGGYILCACGTRTQHRMACNIEDAGFEIRDVISWLYGSGFPKSLNVGKAVDKLQGNEREVVGKSLRHGGGKSEIIKGDYNSPQTKGNSPFEGWGTALKPAQEFFTMARKPLSEKTVAENVLKWGTGAINIDACRVETDDDTTRKQTTDTPKFSGKYNNGKNYNTPIGTINGGHPQGRFPANVIHDGSEEIVALFPDTKKWWGYTKNIKETYQQLTDDKPIITKNKAGFNMIKAPPHVSFTVPKLVSPKEIRGWRGLRRKIGGAMSGKEYRKDRPQNQQ
jgi:hypothetical protein